MRAASVPAQCGRWSSVPAQCGGWLRADGPHSAQRRLRQLYRRPWALALAVALPLAALYLILAPPAADLAAATYRSDLFARAGFTTWDTGWYTAHGHWLPAYSLLSPALGALLGVRVLLALSALAAAVLFGLVAERAFGQTEFDAWERRRGVSAPAAAAVVFALGFCVGMLSGRVPFDLGFAIGLAAVLALIGGRVALALVLAGLTSAASPVAGAFLALAGIVAAAERSLRKENPASEIALAAAALAPIAVLSIAYPEGGYEPFAASSFWPAFAGVLLLTLAIPRRALSPRGRRTLRVGALIYALVLLGAYVLRTPMGGNAARLGALLAAPLMTGVLWEHRRGTLLLLAPALSYWQLITPIHDLASIAGDPSVRASYYAPLLRELRALRHGAPTIVEVPLTRAHWEAAYLPRHDGVALARGWERQLDTRYAALFYRPTLPVAAYRAWLEQNRVEYVALPDVPLDRAGRLEGRLAEREPPYLRAVWSSEHWRLYRFMG